MWNLVATQHLGSLKIRTTKIGDDNEPSIYSSSMHRRKRGEWGNSEDVGRWGGSMAEVRCMVGRRGNK